MELITVKSWRWLKVRVEGLLGVETSLLRYKLYPPKDK